VLTIRGVSEEQLEFAFLDDRAANVQRNSVFCVCWPANVALTVREYYSRMDQSANGPIPTAVAAVNAMDAALHAPGRTRSRLPRPQGTARGDSILAGQAATSPKIQRWPDVAWRPRSWRWVSFKSGLSHPARISDFQHFEFATAGFCHVKLKHMFISVHKTRDTAALPLGA